MTTTKLITHSISPPRSVFGIMLHPSCIPCFVDPGAARPLHLPRVTLTHGS